MKKRVGERFDNDMFQVSIEDVVMASLGIHPDKCLEASINADLRRPTTVGERRYRTALVMGTREPMLNAQKKTVEKDLRTHAFDSSGSTHAKDRLYKTVLVKPTTGKAAQTAGSWATHEWKVYTLKFSPGLVLVNNRGEETDVFPGWGKIKSTLEALGFQVIR